MNIVLASKSPRRRELLKNMGIKYTAMVSNEEEKYDASAEPSEIVKQLALCKALNVQKNCTEALIIGADTVVVLDGEIFGKPKDRQDAEDMLMRLSGRCHKVYTGLAVIHNDLVVNESVCTDVYFKSFERDYAKKYVLTGEPMDKAGAYGIQEKGAMLVEKIDGDYFNVVGLPVCRLAKILKEKFGIDCL